jgi:hypothetical protein
MTDPNASCTLRLNRDFVVISHHFRKGGSIPDTTLKAERGAACSRTPVLWKGIQVYTSLIRGQAGFTGMCRVDHERSSSSESRSA